MAPGANTYGTVAGIQRLIGDIVPSRTFSDSTVPSTAQVEAELDNVAAEINAELDVQGYLIPINATDYPTAYALAKAANEYGAAARLLSTIPPETYNPDEQVEDTGETRPQQYEKLLNRFLNRVRKNMLRAGRRTGRLHKFYAGSQADDNGYTKKPLFTRDMDSFPGSRSLTESEAE